MAVAQQDERWQAVEATRAYLGNRAQAVLVALLGAILALAGCQSSSSGAWQNLGPGDGSVVLSLTVDAASQRLLYAGTSGGIVYRGEVRSTVVTPTRGIPRDAAVSALATDAGHGGIVYAGTSRGVYVSGDYGGHWQARSRGLPSDDGIGALAVRPTSGAAAPTLYAGTQQHGVYVSHDGGATWDASSAGLPARADVYGLTYASATSSLYAALVAGGVYLSRDGGQTWVARSDGLPANSDTFVVLAPSGSSAPADQPPLYAGTSKGLYASVDGGQTWQLRASGIGTPRVLALASDPTQPTALYAGTDDAVYHSTDGGQRWSLVAPGISHHVAAIVVLADTQGHPVVFAGAGDTLRYPPGPAANPWGRILTTIVFLLLLGGLFLSYRRALKHKRRLPTRAVRRRARDPASPRFASPASDPGERAGRNGHRPDQR